jgi:NTP pyrophosphatase (non-canonical NTP hydrolase)
MLKIKMSNYDKVPLRMWQEHFKTIYGKKNSRLRPEDIWFRVLENASKVAENLRRYKYAKAFESLAHVTCWISGFATRQKKDLETVVWKKYPYICPYCRKDTDEVIRPCSCGIKRVELEEANSYVKETMIRDEMMKYFADKFKNLQPSKLDDWIVMYKKLYGNVIYSIPIEHIGFHLMEEIGEVSRVLRRKKEFEDRVKNGKEKGTDHDIARQQFEYDLDSEIADVFSWVCTLVHKIQLLSKALKEYHDGMPSISIKTTPVRETRYPIEIPEVTFSEILYSVYGKGCPNCHNVICSEDCFLSECKFMRDGGQCGYDWTGKDRCAYGYEQSNKCGSK